MDTEHRLRRAAECLLLAVQTADPDERLAMLKTAQVWLERSEPTKDSDDHRRAA